MIYKKILFNDLKQLYKYDREEFDTHSYSYDQILDIFNNSGYIIIGAYDDGGLYGYSIVCIIDKEIGDLQKIFVHSKYRRNNVGTNLIKNIGKYVKELFAEVRENNVPAIKFYQKNNFILISKRNNYYGSNENALVFKKKFK
ncbi:MAG: GNAT family N-acetyltransferase [Mycoplasmataceae bacterium]|jgi:ribosomal protein S18 acetylase RimI-like enzyme|nr:GNAT family N-acetyltransferase [Mycoplasmataceae bacterium]